MRLVVVDTDPEAGSELQKRLVGLGHEANLTSSRRDALAAIRPSTTNVVLISTDKLGYSICNLLRRRPAFGRVRLLMYGSSRQRKTMEQHARLSTRADGYLTLPVMESELEDAVSNVSKIAERVEAKVPYTQVLATVIWGAGLVALASSAVLASVGRVLHKPGWEPAIRGLTFAGLTAYVAAEVSTWISRGSLPRWRIAALVVVGFYLAVRVVG